MILNPVTWWKRRRYRRMEDALAEMFREAREAMFTEGRLDRYGPWTIHGPAICADDETCCFHKPSAHHMREWPMFIRLDRPDVLTERTCEHGVGHPDPDSLAWIASKGGDASVSGIHGCDGCCAP